MLTVRPGTLRLALSIDEGVDEFLMKRNRQRALFGLDLGPAAKLTDPLADLSSHPVQRPATDVGVCKGHLRLLGADLAVRMLMGDKGFARGPLVDRRPHPSPLLVAGQACAARFARTHRRRRPRANAWYPRSNAATRRMPRRARAISPSAGRRRCRSEPGLSTDAQHACHSYAPTSSTAPAPERAARRYSLGVTPICCTKKRVKWLCAE